MKWEMFHDPSYYHMWAVRPVGARSLNDSLHFNVESLAGHAVRFLDAATAPPSVDWLAQVIREVDGNHSLGAGELAEKIVERMAARDWSSM